MVFCIKEILYACIIDLIGKFMSTKQVPRMVRKLISGSIVYQENTLCAISDMLVNL